MKETFLPLDTDFVICYTNQVEGDAYLSVQTKYQRVDAKKYDLTASKIHTESE